jgi:Flp pilus assembly pilin Flp
MSRFCDRLITQLRDFREDSCGATAIEYALIASGISLAIISTIWTLGASIKTNLYDKLATLF